MGQKDNRANELEGTVTDYRKVQHKVRSGSKSFKSILLLCIYSTTFLSLSDHVGRLLL